MTEIISKQKIHLVTGKGGVGKSTVAAGLAFHLASKGEKTLLVEVGERSFFSNAFGTSIGFEPIQADNGLWLSRWQGEECLKEYLGHLLKLQSLANLFFENRVMKALVNSAPALKELAISGKLTSGPRRVGPPLEFEHIVLDAYSTGHFKALMNSSIGMAEAVGFGPMGEQSRGITKILCDQEITKIYAVTIPEELPIKETGELLTFMRSSFQQNPVVVMNKSLGTRVPIVEIEALASEMPQDCFLQHLFDKGKEEEQAVENLGANVVRLKNQYIPASKELYRSVGLDLGGALES